MNTTCLGCGVTSDAMEDFVRAVDIGWLCLSCSRKQMFGFDCKDHTPEPGAYSVCKRCGGEVLSIRKAREVKP